MLLTYWTISTTLQWHDWCFLFTFTCLTINYLIWMAYWVLCMFSVGHRWSLSRAFKCSRFSRIMSARHPYWMTLAFMIIVRSWCKRGKQSSSSHWKRYGVYCPALIVGLFFSEIALTVCYCKFHVTAQAHMCYWQTICILVILLSCNTKNSSFSIQIYWTVHF